MNFITLTVNNYGASAKDLCAINQRLDQIMATQGEIAQTLRTVSEQLNKAFNEITTQIQTLEDAIANAGGSTPEVDDAVAALKLTAQKLDDIVADLPAPAPAPDPAP